MHWAEVLGYVGALFTIGTYSMKTMIPLRIIGLCANCVFVVYGYFGHVYPSLFLHCILLPLNAVRLHQMLQLVEKVQAASKTDLNMDWLKPFMSKRSCRAGEIIFRKGDPSTAMYYTVAGKYQLKEIGADIAQGQVVGEVGLIAPDNKRTLTLECVEDGELLSIDYGQVKQLYFQNPRFGFYFLQLISQRLFKDIERLERRATRPG